MRQDEQVMSGGEVGSGRIKCSGLNEGSSVEGSESFVSDSPLSSS